jgi:hypothetical protein
MRFLQILVAAAAAKVASAGFATYKEIRAGFDNSGEIAYYELDRSNTLFLYIQITAGGNYSHLIDDFKTLARNYGERGVSVVPRVRYGNEKGDVVSEPENLDMILEDVAAWGEVFSDVIQQGLIEIPVIQAGFLGLWGEWHASRPIIPAVPASELTECRAGTFVQERASTKLMRTSLPRAQLSRLC